MSSTSQTLSSSSRTRRPPRVHRQTSIRSNRLDSIDSDDEASFTNGVTEDWQTSRIDINVPPNFTMADIDLSPRRLGKHMRDLLSDSRFWLELVGRLGFDRRVFDAEKDPNLDILSRYYDSSDLGLLRVFHLFDSDKDRIMTKEEMIRGLTQQGMLTNSDEVCCHCIT